MKLKISLVGQAFIISVIWIVVSAVLVYVLTKLVAQPIAVHYTPTISMSFHTNIIKETSANTDFRRVLFTGSNSQLVVMSIPPGGEIGEETHKYTEQTLFFLSGTGEAVLNGAVSPIGSGDVIVVTVGMKHNFRNTGTSDLKVYTVYAPPNHIDGRVHITKADADADTADEAVGESAPR